MTDVKTEQTSKPAGRLAKVTWMGLLVGVVTVVALKASGCAGVGPKASKEQINQLKRTTAGETLSYLHGGDEVDPRVIYVHGTPGDGTGFADFLVTPVTGLHAISIDRPGFGQSGSGGAMVSFEEQAWPIEPLLVRRNGRWPVLMGHSLGGPIVARVAADYPDKVAGIVIVAGSLDPELEKIGTMQSVAQTGFVRFFLPRALDNGLMELKDAKQQTTDLATVLERVRCPVIIIHGTVDKLVPFGNVAYMKRTLTRAASVEVVELEGQGHFIPWQRPEEIRHAVGSL